MTFDDTQVEGRSCSKGVGRATLRRWILTRQRQVVERSEDGESECKLYDELCMPGWDATP